MRTHKVKPSRAKSPKCHYFEVPPGNGGYYFISRHGFRRFDCISDSDWKAFVDGRVNELLTVHKWNISRSDFILGLQKELSDQLKSFKSGLSVLKASIAAGAKNAARKFLERQARLKRQQKSNKVTKRKRKKLKSDS